MFFLTICVQVPHILTPLLYIKTQHDYRATNELIGSTPDYMRSQQLGFVSRHPAKYCRLSKNSGWRADPP